MTRNKRPLLILIGGLIVAGGVFLFSLENTVLCLANLDRPCSLRFMLRPGERFHMFYTHSIYEDPVTEEFEFRENGIALKGVRAQHPGVMEYYGFEETLEFHPLDRFMGPAFTIKIAMQPGQGFIIGGKEILLQRIGEGGERIEVRAGTESIARGFLRHLMPAFGKCGKDQR